MLTIPEPCGCIANSYKARGNSFKDWVTFQNGDYQGYHPQYTIAPQSLGTTTTPTGGGLTSGSTGLRSQIVNQGLKYLGTPYVFGGDSLTQGVDCSGLVHSLYQMFSFIGSSNCKRRC